MNIDVLLKSRKSTTNVIPAKAGIQEFHGAEKTLDPGFRRGDDFHEGIKNEDFERGTG